MTNRAEATARPQARQCAICRKRSGAIGGYATALRHLGIPGNYAHPGCLRRKQVEAVNSHDTLLEQRDKLTAMLAKCVERLKRELVTYEYGAPMLDALITEAESLLAEIRGGK